MRMWRLVPSLVLAALIVAGGLAQTHPDFSGTWTFNQLKSAQPGPDGKVVLAALMGDEFTVQQVGTSLNFSIKSGAIRAAAIYKLDGSESRNMSPGGPGQPDIEVVSTAAWQGDKLIINSTSTSPVQGRPVTIVTRRELWIDPDGNLILVRTGTPANMVTPSRSVYSKAKPAK